jgi:hypothetical protein
MAFSSSNTLFLTGATGFVGMNLINFFQGKYQIKSYNRNQTISKNENIVIHLAGKAHDLKNQSIENFIAVPETVVNVSQTLNKVITDNGYENSYYEWFGYGRMVFYNCIVLKKYIDVIELGFRFNKFSVLKGFEKNQNKIFELSKSQFKKGEEKFRDVLKYIYPIKNPHYEIEPSSGYPEDNFNNFCYSVYDLMFE